MKDWRNLLERAFPLELTQPRRPMKQGKTSEELASEDLASKEFICEDLASDDLADEYCQRSVGKSANVKCVKLK